MFIQLRQKDIDTFPPIAFYTAVAHHTIGNAMPSMVRFKVYSGRRRRSARIYKQTILNKKVFCAAHANSLPMIFHTSAFSNHYILSIPSKTYPVAARLHERHVLHLHAHRTKKRQRIAPFAVRIGRLLVVGLAHAQSAALFAQTCERGVRRIRHVQEEVALAVKLALLSQKLHSILEHYIRIGMGFYGFDDPRRAIVVEHNALRARIERRLHNLRSILCVPAEIRNLDLFLRGGKSAGAKCRRNG